MNMENQDKTARSYALLLGLKRNRAHYQVRSANIAQFALSEAESVRETMFVAGASGRNTKG